MLHEISVVLHTTRGMRIQISQSLPVEGRIFLHHHGVQGCVHWAALLVVRLLHGAESASCRQGFSTKEYKIRRQATRQQYCDPRCEPKFFC